MMLGNGFKIVLNGLCNDFEIVSRWTRDIIEGHTYRRGEKVPVTRTKNEFGSVLTVFINSMLEIKKKL
jgi:20S proteasome alpha/beta subunit